MTAGHRWCNVSLHKVDYLAKKDNVGRADYGLELIGLPTVDTVFVK